MPRSAAAARAVAVAPVVGWHPQQDLPAGRAAPAGRRRRPEIVRVEEDLCTFPVRDGPRRSRAGIYGPQVGRGQHPPTDLLLLPKGVAVRSRTRARARALTPSWSAAAAPVPAGRSASALRWAW